MFEISKDKLSIPRRNSVLYCSYLSSFSNRAFFQFLTNFYFNCRKWSQNLLVQPFIAYHRFLFSLNFNNVIKKSLSSGTSMAGTPLEQWKYVRDRGSTG